MAIKHNYYYTDEQEKKRQASWDRHIRSSYHQPDKIDARQNYDKTIDRNFKKYGEIRPEYPNTYFNEDMKAENDEGNQMIKRKPAKKTLDKAKVKKSVNELLNYRTTKKTR